MASKGKKISLFDASGMLTKDALLGYVYNELTMEARQEVDRQLAQNEMYRDMVEGFRQINNRAEAEHLINEMNTGIAEASGSEASVPGIGENVGEFFWNYRRVAAVVGGVLLLSVGVLTFALWKVSNPENIALNKEVEQKAPVEVAEGKKKADETKTAGNANTGYYSTAPAGADSSKTIAGFVQTPPNDVTITQPDQFTTSNTTTTKTVAPGSATTVPGEALNLRKETAPEKKGEVKTPVGTGTSTPGRQVAADSITVNQDLAGAGYGSYEGAISDKENLKTGKNKSDDKDSKRMEEQTVPRTLDNTMLSNSAGTQQSQLSYKGMTLQVAEQMPAFPGGDAAFESYLSSNLRYPEKAKKDGVQGNVYLSFIIGTGGKVKEIAVINGVNKEINAEAIRLIANMPKWEPGKMHGEPVQVQLYRTIAFKIPEEEPALEKK